MTAGHGRGDSSDWTKSHSTRSRLTRSGCQTPTSPSSCHGPLTRRCSGARSGRGYRSIAAVWGSSASCCTGVASCSPRRGSASSERRRRSTSRPSWRSHGCRHSATSALSSYGWRWALGELSRSWPRCSHGTVTISYSFRRRAKYSS